HHHTPSSLFLLILRTPPPPTLFPYTTLFRSAAAVAAKAMIEAISESFMSQPRLCSRAGPAAPPQRARADRVRRQAVATPGAQCPDRKSTRLNSSHVKISYAVFCLKKKKKRQL